MWTCCMGVLCSLLAGPLEVERWSIHEGSFQAKDSYPDPARDLEVTVEFTSPGGRKEKVLAFWDGGKTYRYRFSPGETGAWKAALRWKDASSSGVEKDAGAFICVPARKETPLLKHGPIRVSKDGFHLVHADGTPFFWLACTAWNGALSPDRDGFREYLADRAAKRFSAIQFVTTQWRAATGDRDGRVAFEGRERIALNPAFFQRLDGMFDEVNRHGLFASPVILWAIGDPTGRSPGSNLPESEAVHLAKYIVSRYGAHHPLWALGGDGAYGGGRAEEWKRIARAVFPEPEKSVITMHPQGMQWVAREFEKEPWFDFLGYQSGHGDDDPTLRWLVEGPPAKAWRMEPQRPVINLEPNYEGHLAYQSRKPITDFMVRRAAYWSLLVSPTAGVTYGAHGIWFFSDRAEVPLEHGRTGVAPPYREAMKLPGSTQMKHLRTLFDSIEWWRLRPAPALLLRQPGREAIRRFAAAAKSESGDLAVVYVPEDREIALSMDQFPSPMEARWFDPRTGEAGSAGSVPNTEARSFPAPVDGDWVLVLERPRPARAGTPFDDAVAAWHLAGPEDSAGLNSALRPVGAVRLGEELSGPEREASLLRRGDGKVALLEGGWLDALKGAEGELDLSGDRMTLLVRLRDPSGKWNSTPFSRHGGHRNLTYNLFTHDPGSGMELGFELGTERGVFPVRVHIEEIGAGEWHDIIARYDGRLLELFVDGVLVHQRPALGRLRRGNPEPLILGGEPHQGKVTRPFRGMIDHAALWSRALGDAEVARLSGSVEEVSRKREAFQGRRAERERLLLEKLARDPQRPRYHFLPPAHWMNDPNGLCHFEGEYHLFYQYNPNGAFWGTMHWGHAKSRDLVHWTHLPVALAPTPGGPDWDGCFTGCMVNHGGVPTIVYTAVTPEVQCLATPRDGLVTWEKHSRNPVIASPPPDLKVTGFRDPWVWKEDDGWYMVVGSGIKGAGGAALLYRSRDLLEWDYLHPLLAGEKKFGEMWECPNFFPLGAKHVLLVSVHGTTLYFVGSYREHRFTPEVEGDTDFGRSFYAAQSLLDPSGRRLLFGWLKEGRSDAAQRAAGWSGVQSLPRVLSLLPDGRLGMDPLPEVKALRGERVGSIEVFDSPRIVGVQGGGLEVLAEIEPAGALESGLRLRYPLDGETIEEAEIFYSAAGGRLGLKRGNHLREGPFRLSAGENLKLHLFLDASVVEVFANGRACLTDRIYQKSGRFEVDFFARGGGAKVRSLSAFEMRSIW